MFMCDRIHRLGAGAVWCLALLVALVVSGTGATAADEASTNALYSDTLQVGDQVKITLEHPEWNSKPPIEQKIKEDGTISLPYIKSIPAAKKSPAQLEKDIEAAFVPKFYKHISVIVVTGGRDFYVLGQVKLPNRYPYMSDLTVTKAIAAAGGFTDFSKKTAVKVTRADGTVETINCSDVEKDPKLDRPVYPGDKIFVDRRVF